MNRSATLNEWHKKTTNAACIDRRIRIFELLCSSLACASIVYVSTRLLLNSVLNIKEIDVPFVSLVNEMKTRSYTYVGGEENFASVPA